MPLGPHGVGQLAHHVALGVPPGSVGVADRGGPEAEAVVVLGDEHDVAGAGCGEPVGPVVRIPLSRPGHEVVDEAA